MMKQRKTNLLLLGLLILFSAGTLAVKLTEHKETAQDAPERAYYLTAYDNPEDLLAVQVTNETGTLTIVHHEDTWFTDTPFPGVEPDEEAVAQLFETASRIRVSSPIEGAKPEDEQFGLTAPAAKILVEDLNGGGISFLVGNLTPDGSAFYVCAAGGSEVCTLPAGTGDRFLGDICGYLDLRVFGDIDPGEVTKISVSDPDGAGYELTAAGKGEITGTRYYSLTSPVRIPVALSGIRDIFSALEQVRAAEVLEGQPVKEKDLLYELSLTQENKDPQVYRIGYAKDRTLCIENTSAGLTNLVDELPAFLAYDAAAVLGGKLLSLNAADVLSVGLSAGGETVTYDFETEGTDAGLMEDLNRIPVAMTDNSAGASQEALRCIIKTKREEEELELVFFERGNRQYGVSVNGICAFECARSALQPLLDRMGGT